jgi:protein phosphatase
MTPFRGPILVSARARTDLGRTRDHNEDAFLVADLTSRTTDLTHGGPHRVGERGSLFLVADGMGGAAAGEVASSMAVDLIFRHLVESWNKETDGDPERFAHHLRAAVEQANEQIHKYSTEHPDVRGMGTTATLAGVLDGNLYLAQVGDSRAYLVRGGVATQLTKDQSLMQRLVDAGELTEEEAEQSERRNIILQALGPDARIRVDLTWQELRRGDTLVMCSDGLSGQVKREEIAQLVAQNLDLDTLCDRLITLANERGGPDNITTVVAHFDGEGLAGPDRGEAEVGYRAYPTNEPDSDEHAMLSPVQPSASPAPAPAPPSVSPPPPSPPQSAALPQTPPVSEALAESHAIPARRSGSPATIALVGAGFLLLLLVLYLLIRR